MAITAARCPPGAVTIVLCRPADPRNIGGAVRAVANFGLAGLCVVTDAPPPLEAVHAYSGGSLAAIRYEVEGDLRTALRDAVWVLGTSRRHHHEDGPAEWPAAGLGARLGDRHPVSILFGHETSGLSRAELDYCDAVVEIPTADAFRSMNLSHAVACVGYELSRPDPDGWVAAPPTTTQGRALDRDAVFRELERLCVELRYPPGRSPQSFARRLRRLLTRARATAAEMSMVTGVLRELRRLRGD